MNKNIYVIGYSIGEYSDRSEENVAAVLDREYAHHLVDCFNAIAKIYDEARTRYHAEQAKAGLRWDMKHGEIPQISSARRLGKQSNPEWAKMPEKEWMKFVEDYKVKRTKACNEAQVLRDLRTAYVKDETRTFWDDVRAGMPQHLRDVVALYPCRDGYSSPFFEVNEVPIWHPLS